MDLLQAGGESPLAVLPQSAVLVQPGQTALHHPALGHDREGMQFAVLGNVHRHACP